MGRMQLIICCFLLLSPVLTGEEQPALSLLIIDSQEGEPYESIRSALFESFYARGYTRGSSLRVNRYSLGNEVVRMNRLLHEESAAQYDAVLVNGTIAVLAVQDILLDKGMIFGHERVFFAGVTDPIGLGLIDAYNEAPSGSFTGAGFTVDLAERLAIIRKLLPEAQTIGLVYSEMPQSFAYRSMLETAMSLPDFHDLDIHYRSVEFVMGEAGYRRSVQLARDYVLELDPLVDVFLTPSDQMGVHYSYSKMVFATASKPLIGISPEEVWDDNGASAAVFTSYTGTGEILADMILRFVGGEDFSQLHPRLAQARLLVHQGRATRFGMHIPESAAMEGGVY